MRTQLREGFLLSLVLWSRASSSPAQPGRYAGVWAGQGSQRTKPSRGNCEREKSEWRSQRPRQARPPPPPQPQRPQARAADGRERGGSPLPLPSRLGRVAVSAACACCIQRPRGAGVSRGRRPGPRAVSGARGSASSVSRPPPSPPRACGVFSSPGQEIQSVRTRRRLSFKGGCSTKVSSLVVRAPQNCLQFCREEREQRVHGVIVTTSILSTLSLCARHCAEPLFCLSFDCRSEPARWVRLSSFRSGPKQGSGERGHRHAREGRGFADAGPSDSKSPASQACFILCLQSTCPSGQHQPQKATCRAGCSRVCTWASLGFQGDRGW